MIVLVQSPALSDNIRPEFQLLSFSQAAPPLWTYAPISSPSHGLSLRSSLSYATCMSYFNAIERPTTPFCHTWSISHPAWQL